MQKRDPIADAMIDQIGADVVRDYFNLSSQRLHMWRVRGIPYRQRIAFHNLALVRGVSPPPEFLEPLGIAA